MATWRFSLAGLLLTVMLVALLPSVVTSYYPNASRWNVAIGGLNLCAIVFAIVCLIMGQSPLRAFVHTTVFYAWGLVCLFLLNAVDLGYILRWLLALCGILYASWVWLMPEAAWVASRHMEGEPRNV